jgi:hypothetical protein
MADFLYRFRPIRSLLGERKELERQAIYFASPEELNDPMEGLRDVLWSGDEIAWANLLRHYLLCLQDCFASFLIAGADELFTRNSIPVFRARADLETDAYRDIFDRICAQFFANKSLAGLPKALADRSKPVRRKELASHLLFIHRHAIDVISTVFYEHGLVAEASAGLAESVQAVGPSEIVRLVNALEEEHHGKERVAEIIGELANNQDTHR